MSLDSLIKKNKPTPALEKKTMTANKGIDNGITYSHIDHCRVYLQRYEVHDHTHR